MSQTVLGFFAGYGEKGDAVVDLYTGNLYNIDENQKVTLLPEKFDGDLEKERDLIIQDKQGGDSRIVPLFCGDLQGNYCLAGAILDFDGQRGVWEL